MENISWKTRLHRIGARKQGRVWKMASGRYSDVEYDVWRLYQRPELYSMACRDLLKKACIGKLEPVTWFIGLERDGIALALELARQTGASAGFATKKGASAELVDFSLPKNASVFLVVDVHTAGTTFVKIREAIEKYNGHIANPLLAIVNRSGHSTVCLWPNEYPQGYFHDQKIVALVETNEPGWRKEDCPPHLKDAVEKCM